MSKEEELIKEMREVTQLAVQSRDAKQKAIVKQARSEATFLQGYIPSKITVDLASLLNNLANEIERLQKIVDERSKG